MAGRLAATLVLSALAASLAPTAAACVLLLPEVLLPDAPPGLSAAEALRYRRGAEETKMRILDEALRLGEIEHQTRLWDEADAVMLARVEHIGTVLRERPGRPGRTREYESVDLRPVKWLKGGGAGDAFRLSYTDYTSCGPQPEWDAVNGAPEQEFVVFVRGGAPAQATVTMTFAPVRLVAPRIRQALGLPPSQ